MGYPRRRRISNFDKCVRRDSHAVLVKSRARKVIGNVKNYATFEVERLPLEKFAKTWLPGLQRDGLLVGINWSGEMASGYDMTPEEVADRLSIMKR